jgi:hypothetical protein
MRFLFAFLILAASLRAQDAIPEGPIDAFLPRARLLHNPGSQMLSWDQVKDFLVKDNSNQHEYALNRYDCKQFALELMRRSEAHQIRCFLTLIQYAEQPSGHCEVVFPTTDKGDVYVDFAPIVTGKTQVPSKSIDFLVIGQRRISVPLAQLPDEFSNTPNFYMDYLHKQEQLQSASKRLEETKTELEGMFKTLTDKLSKGKDSKAVEALQARYEAASKRYEAASRVYQAYVEQYKSPYDTSHPLTVRTLIRY